MLEESGRSDSNRRRPAWEADILPLNYARNCLISKGLRKTPHLQCPFCGKHKPFSIFRLHYSMPEAGKWQANFAIPKLWRACHACRCNHPQSLPAALLGGPAALRLPPNVCSVPVRAFWKQRLTASLQTRVAPTEWSPSENLPTFMTCTRRGSLRRKAP